jgi:DNA-binding CsgD family transcriptional regulator
MGKTNREISVELFVSSKTVEYHLGNIYSKLGIPGRRNLRDLVQQYRRPL